MTLPVIIVMGVSGAGKSTIAKPLAEYFDFPFLEGDDLHSAANVAKMKAGTPLTDADRAPWLAAIGAWIDERTKAGEGGVVACSALRRVYRDQLRAGRPNVKIAYLNGSKELIAERLEHREGHFMPPALLDSQFATLEAAYGGGRRHRRRHRSEHRSPDRRDRPGGGGRRAVTDRWDAVVIGAGPAGLTAGIYLGRFLRRVLVIDGGDSRAGWIPTSHNHPGFPEGVHGADLLTAMRSQAQLYGAEIRQARVADLSGSWGEFRITLEDGDVLEAMGVIVATGVKDVPLPFPHLFDAVQHGLVRICPICDAYEVRGQDVAVVGAGDHATREALFVRHYSDRVTLLLIGGADEIEPARWDELERAKIEVVKEALRDVQVRDDRVLAFDHGGGASRTFDVVYSALGSKPRSDLLERAGAGVNEAGCALVRDHQRTSVEGLYAAGDVVLGLNQISVAQAEGAIAATDIHNRLRGVIV